MDAHELRFTPLDNFLQSQRGLVKSKRRSFRGCTKLLRQLKSAPSSDPSVFQLYSSNVSTATSKVQQAGGRFSGIVTEWIDHVTVAGIQAQASSEDAVKKQWMAEEEIFIRRVLNQLMEAYQFGSTATAGS